MRFRVGPNQSRTPSDRDAARKTWKKAKKAQRERERRIERGFEGLGRECYAEFLYQLMGITRQTAGGPSADATICQLGN